MTNDAEEWISSFLHGDAMDSIRAYVVAGRTQQHAPDEQLRLALVMAMNLIAEGHKSFLELARSTASELLIRKQDLP